MNFLDFSNYDWDTWTTFIAERWYVLVIALIVVVIIANVIRTAARWAIILLIVIGVIMYSGYSLDDIKNISAGFVSSGIEELKEIGSKVADNVKQEAIDAMIKDAEKASYKTEKDGSFTVSTDSIVVTGKAGEDEVSISVKGAPAFKVKTSDVINQFIEQAKNNGK